MDKNAFQRFVLPMIVQVLAVLGKYIVPPLCALAGIESAKGNEWWLATATILGGVIVGGLTSYLTKKKILTAAAATADEKIADATAPTVTGAAPKE